MHTVSDLILMCWPRSSIWKQALVRWNAEEIMALLLFSVVLHLKKKTYFLFNLHLNLFAFGNYCAGVSSIGSIILDVNVITTSPTRCKIHPVHFVCHFCSTLIGYRSWLDDPVPPFPYPSSTFCFAFWTFQTQWN